jgi:ATP-dependent exoDNAse (exonuclease V) beta subunit
LAEEQRLAYVALSRAEQTLLITWSKGRNDPRFPDREPSRFLEPIDTVLGEIERQTAPVTGEQRRARLEAIRHELEANAPVIEETSTVLGR